MRTFVVATALALVVSVGCGGDNRALSREWTVKTRKDCLALARLLDELHQTLNRLQRAFETELRKTGPKRALYNPGMFGRLLRMAHKLDLTQPAPKEQLRRKGWMIHYRFAKGAPVLLPRLHRLVALLRQLRASLELGGSQEQKFGTQLAQRKPGWTPPAKSKQPRFGVLIQDDKHAAFTGALGKPIKRGPQGKCVQADSSTAEGHRLSDGKCYFFSKQPAPKGDCDKGNNTLRIFANADPELNKALRCLGVEDVLMEGFRFRLLDLELILAELKELDVGLLVKQARRSGGGE